MQPSHQWIAGQTESAWISWSSVRSSQQQRSRLSAEPAAHPQHELIPVSAIFDSSADPTLVLYNNRHNRCQSRSRATTEPISSL